MAEDDLLEQRGHGVLPACAASGGAAHIRVNDAALSEVIAAIESGAFDEVSAQGSLRVLRRTAEGI